MTISVCQATSRLCSVTAWISTPLGLVACRPAGVLDPQGPIAAAECLILFNATAIMLVVVVPVIVMTLFFAWWYRRSNTRAAYRPEWAYSGRIELVVWAIPAMVVILLGGVGWISSHQLDPSVALRSDAKPLRIEVVSMDWKWLFIYPELKIATVDELIVPQGIPIEFDLTSATVMNAFFIPQLGSQIYTMPGMVTHLYLMADHAGEYPGFSSHFSGDGFSDMRFVVRAVLPTEFETWRVHAQENHTPLDRSRFLQLKHPSNSHTTESYGHVDDHLFDYIVRTSAPDVATLQGTH